jgi:hypothetical protein
MKSFPMLSSAVVLLLVSAVLGVLSNHLALAGVPAPAQSEAERIAVAQAGLLPGQPEKGSSSPPARNRLDSTDQGRLRIKAKLESTRLQEVFYDGFPLPEVVNHLREQTEQQDPEKLGVNFMIVNRNDHPEPLATGEVPLPVPIRVDLGSAIVRINPPLKNIRLIDALDAVVKQADVPIQYSIEEYAVVFSEKTPAEATQVFSLAKYLAGRSGQNVGEALKDLNELFEITWGLHQQTASSQLRFAPRLHLHRGTQLLIAVGQPEHLNIIAQVIRELEGLSSAAPVAPAPREPPSK